MTYRRLEEILLMFGFKKGNHDKIRVYGHRSGATVLLPKASDHHEIPEHQLNVVRAELNTCGKNLPRA